MDIRLSDGSKFPMLEMHKAKIVKKIELKPIGERKKVMNDAGNNTFLLRNKDIFLDMLTDSGVNAMSDRQQAAMFFADDAYAGSESFFRLQETTKDIFGKDFLIPTHQGRASENIIAKSLVKTGNVALMNYHFTTTKTHIVANGGTVVEMISEKGLIAKSDEPFKGDIDLQQLEDNLEKHKGNIAFLRIEVGTNLIGGQPVSLKNIIEVCKLCRDNNVKTVLDASLLTDNLYFIKVREKEYKDKSIREITRTISEQFDIIYFSARKLGSARGGAILLNDKDLMIKMQDITTMYEGFMTYGGMSIMEIEAINIGIQESMDFDMISQGPQSIEFLVSQFVKSGVPAITPGGGLGAHLNAMEFCEHLPLEQYRAGSLATALFIVSGVRGMERGTLSEDRNPDGSERIAKVETLRLACPRRVFTISQLSFVADRVKWLYENRSLIGGLKFEFEPKIMRFFLGKLTAIGDWQEKLVAKFKNDFGDSL